MDRRQFLSIGALPLLAMSGLKVGTPLVALPLHLTRGESLRNRLLAVSSQMGSSTGIAKPRFFYYRQAEFAIAHQALSMGLVHELWTTPAMLTPFRTKFKYTAALGVHALQLDRFSAGLREVFSAGISIGYLSLPNVKTYFAQTSAEVPTAVRCFHQYRQNLFGEPGISETTILDSLPMSVIKKMPELRGARLHLDTFSLPLNLAMVIKNDFRGQDFTGSVQANGRRPPVPKELAQIHEKFQVNSTQLIQNGAGYLNPILFRG